MNSRSAPHASASSTTAAVGSTASITRRTGAAGSPHTVPGASHDSAVEGGNQVSSRPTTSARVGSRPEPTEPRARARPRTTPDLSAMTGDDAVVEQPTRFM